METATAPFLIRSKQTRLKIGDVSETTFWRMRKDPSKQFPEPIEMNGQKYWLESEVDTWIQNQADTRLVIRA